MKAVDDAQEHPGDGNQMVLLRSTYSTEADGEAAARRLLDKRAACCVHLSPIRSLYRWKGRIEDDSEWLLEARTPKKHQDRCWDALLDGHPYDTPLVEIVAETKVPARYAKWAHQCTIRG